MRALVNRRELPGELGSIVDQVKADALDPRQLEGTCEGADVVFSCIGASVQPAVRKGRRSFENVDTPANLNLLREAENAGVNRFVYVSVAGHERFGHLRYVRAHETVVDRLLESGLSGAVVRPPGFFSAFREVLAMAEKGAIPVIGDGSARTNPIHDVDLAGMCADAVEGINQELVAGGPEILTRREIAELAFEALGREPKIRYVSPTLLRGMAPLMRPFSPRMADLTAFYTEVSTQDLVVPIAGTRLLRDYFQETVRGS